jgi:hypothetical protein
MQRPHGVTWGHGELKLAHDGCHAEYRLLQREYRADAATRPGPEGQVDVAINSRARRRKKPCRIEELGFVPPHAVAMQNVRCNNDHGAAPDLRTGRFVRVPRDAADRCEGRIEPQRLLDDCAGLDQAVDECCGGFVGLSCGLCDEPLAPRG